VAHGLGWEEGSVQTYRNQTRTTQYVRCKPTDEQ